MDYFKRFSEYFITLIVIIAFNFFLPRALPGDPLIQMTEDMNYGIVDMTEDQMQKYRDYYLLDETMPVQFTSYLKKLVKFDLGHSIIYSTSVSKLIFSKMRWTIFLVFSSLFFSTLVGSILGTLSALYRNDFLDKFLYVQMVFLSELPSFILGILLLFGFSVKLKWFPIFGAYSYYRDYASNWEYYKDIIYHGALPIITLSLAKLGSIYYLARNTVVTVLSKSYITTAEAKGLKKRRIIVRHALRNALLPIVTRSFLSIGSMIGGTIIVENVFAYPGLGSLMRESVTNRDYPLIQGIFLIVTLLTLFANLMADVVYKKLDPRIK